MRYPLTLCMMMSGGCASTTDVDGVQCIGLYVRLKVDREQEITRAPDNGSNVCEVKE